MMFKLSQSLLLILGLLFTVSVKATTGIITFNGSIISSTCSIGGSGENATVVLPVVRTAELDAPGKTAGETAFSIVLENCTSDTQDTAYVYFESGMGVNSDGRLNNTAADGAQNVELQIVDTAGNPVQLGNAAQEDTATKMDISSGGASVGYRVRYYATGATTEGAVSSQVTYTINYL